MKKANVIYRIKWIIVALFMTIMVCLQSIPIRAFAETGATSYDKTNIMDDLKGMTIDGEPFDVTQYAFDETRDVQIISFVEYCYSYSMDKQSDYGLYVYLWNPKGLSFVNDGTRNRIEFTYGESNEAPEKYAFTILSKSEESGYEGLFYKLRIDLTTQQRAYILETLNSIARTYHISGIELLQSGEATADEYTVSATFTYSGFAAGYGSDDSTESTLFCTRDGNEVLELEVHPTYYRPGGSNGTNSYTQDTLMSVYFSIPNKMLEQYDKLSGFECSWIKLMTDWAFITGNRTIYNAFMPYIGKTRLYDDKGTSSLLDDIRLGYGFVGIPIEGTYEVGYNLPDSVNAAYKINQLDYCFFAEGGVDSADNYILSSEEIQEWMESYYDKYITDDSANQDYLTVDGNEYPPYAETLFVMADSGVKTTQDFISVKTERSLTEEVISQNWWQAIWGDTTLEYSKTFDGIKAIHKVTEEDMNHTSSVICKSLYISPQDVGAFQTFYAVETNKDRSVFLLRYDVGEYVAFEATEGELDDNGFVTGLKNTDTNARVFRQNVYLNFDVIHVEFEREGESVVIPVVSNPIDIVPDSTPALDTESDKDPWALLSMMFAILAVICLFIFCKPILSFLIRLILEVVLLPFEIIGILFNGGKGK